MMKRLDARAAQHASAITAARAGGMTWAEIGARLGGISGRAARRAFARAQVAAGAGRLVTAEQAPLPDLPPAQMAAPEARSGTGAAQPAAQRAKPAAPATGSNRQTTKEFLATLEQIGGNKK